MEHYNTYVGMDVHTRSIVCKGLNVETGEYYSKSFFDCPTSEIVATWLKTLPQPLYCAYESGCTGYPLARELRNQDINCDMIAITTLAKSVKNKNNKCDKIDAKVILKEISSPFKDYTIVQIPDEETEANRDIVRTLKQDTKKLCQAKQQLNSYLIKNGYVWNQKSKSGKLKKKWTRCYWEWVESINFNYAQKNITLNHLIGNVKILESAVKDLKESIKTFAENKDNIEIVSALSLCNGVDITTAFLVKSEIGDFNRFTSGRKISSWAGFTPKNNSSGEKESHGGISKCGNKYIRKALVEGISSISRWNNLNKFCSKYHDLCPNIALQMANDCNKRCISKYNNLVRKKNKHPNKAKVATANELLRWLWIIGKQVQNMNENK